MQAHRVSLQNQDVERVRQRRDITAITHSHPAAFRERRGRAFARLFLIDIDKESLLMPAGRAGFGVRCLRLPRSVQPLQHCVHKCAETSARRTLEITWQFDHFDLRN